ncbi:MAG: hypothetical protein HUJ71_02760 [Pseudobutyrivibrio sp.]|nr:hypothetical protein [Pseudobutyrivibrio sp.]
MAKKITAKEKREAMEAAKRKQYQAENTKREKKVAEEKKRQERQAAAAKGDKSALTGKRKSGAKVNGLKSVLVFEDKIQMTSFGKGNTAIIEKEIVNDQIADINVKAPQFKASSEEDQYEINRVGAKMDRSGYVQKNISVKNDLINAKDALETRYFGKPMPGNVHIQVAYNILDIEKILAGHIDNIIYAFSNVLKTEDQVEDLIGNLGGKDYASFKENKYYPLLETYYNDNRLRYFGDAFYDTGIDIKAQKTHKVKTTDSKGNKIDKSVENAKPRSEQDVYYMLSLLGRIRQFTKHGRKDNKDNASLYNLDKVLLAEEKAILDKLYASRINALNKDFIEKSKNDLTLVIDYLGANTLSEKKKLVEEYYRYIVCKDARNLGFRVKTLRELMIEKHMPELKGTQYDTVRSKIYKLFDFVILHYYQSEKGAHATESFVNDLRSCTDDYEKNELYKSQADNKWPVFKGTFISIKDKLKNGAAVKTIEKDADLDRISIDEVAISPKDTSYFSKLMFLMTLFLDGKEINDLLTTLINKFENIQSFEDIMEANDMPLFKTDSSYNYKFLINAGDVANELRVVKSVARMETPTPAAKQFMFEEALTLLGFDESENSIFKNSNTIRKFIANNVIESTRFQYLVRYTNMENARKLASSKPIVTFVLKKCPQTQIDRYWLTCGQDKKVYAYNDKIEGLANLICNFDKGIINEDNLNKDKKEEKQAVTAIIGLYLSVVYQIVKGLVFVNSKYTIAIHALERDSVLICKKSVYPNTEGSHYDELFAMTNRYIENQSAYLEERIAQNKKANKHGLDVIKKSKDVVNNETAHYHICRLYRNAIAHLCAVSSASEYVDKLSDNYKVTSYFALYHFFMQEYLINHKEYVEPEFAIKGSIIDEWASKVEEYRGYNRDFLWALNSPFAYNPPRYKKLSIEDIFYNDPEAVVRE